MKFYITDGDNDYLEKAPKFAELYNDGMVIPELIKELQITRGEYRKLRRHCVEEGLITLRKKPYNTKKESYKTNPAYISKSFNNGFEYFIVTKTINNRRVFFANFKEKRQAEKMVELLKECNWDKSKAKELKKQVMEMG